MRARAPAAGACLLSGWLACFAGLPLAASAASAWPPAEQCLPDAIPAERRRRVQLSNGTEGPVGFWVHDWESAKLASLIAMILTQEMLGYEVALSGHGRSSSTGLYATAGCADPNAYIEVDLATGPKCSPNPVYTHHVALEVWGVDKEAVLNERFEAWPQVIPHNLGDIGYTGIEGLYIFREQLDAAAADGLMLEYYREYNASLHTPEMYFESYSAIDTARLKPCEETVLMLDQTDYVKISGDSDGVETMPSGQLVGRCWDGHWWLAPSCRQSPQQCIPVLAGGHGWYLQGTMQKAAVYRMPFALAVAVGMTEWMELGEAHKVLVYWWEPRSRFPTKQPVQILFPPYNKQEREQNNLLSQSERVVLSKWVSATLEEDAQLVHSMLALLSIPASEMNRMIQQSTCQDGRSCADAACEWLRHREHVWRSWLHVQCGKGKGPIGEDATFLQSQAEEWVGCQSCPQGCFSEPAQVGGGWVCPQCAAGRSSTGSGHVGCARCHPGRVQREPSDRVRRKAQNSSEVCSACPSGRYSAGMGSTECLGCPPGTVGEAIRGSRACVACGGWYVADAAAGACRLRYVQPGNYILIAHWLAIFGILVAFWGEVLSVVGLWRPFGCRLVVKDVSFEERAGGSGVFVQCSAHSLKANCPVTVLFKGTETTLDRGRWQVRLLGQTCMQLLNDDGTPLKQSTDQSTDSSQGTVVVPFPASLRRTWKLPGRQVGLPWVLLGMLLLAVAAGLSATPGILGPAQDHHLAEAELVELVLVVLALLSCPAGVVIFALGRWPLLHPSLQPELVKCLRQFKDRLSKRRPSPTPCGPGEGRALEFGEILELWAHFRHFIKDRSMRYTVLNIVLPITRACQLSYAEVVGPRPTMWFVSHSWGSPFRALVHSLKKHAQGVCRNTEVNGGVMPYMEVTFWVCSFAINQWNLSEELGTHIYQSSFYKCLHTSHCRGTVLVLDAFASPLKRSWCLFELLQTIFLEEERNDDGFSGLWLCTESGALRSGGASVEMAMTLADRIAEIRIQDAEASTEKDKAMIDEAIQQMDGGFQRMDEYLRACLMHSLTRTKEAFDQQFSKVLDKVAETRSASTIQVRRTAFARLAASKWARSVGRASLVNPPLSAWGRIQNRLAVAAGGSIFTRGSQDDFSAPATTLGAEVEQEELTAEVGLATPDFAFELEAEQSHPTIDLDLYVPVAAGVDHQGSMCAVERPKVSSPPAQPATLKL